MGKFIQLATILLVSANVFAGNKKNETKPIVFLTSPFLDSGNVSDSSNSESKLNEDIVAEGHSYKPTGIQKQVVSSQGYQLEVIDDNTSEDPSERKLSERQISVYPSSAARVPQSLIDHFLSSEFEDNSAKEDLANDFISKGKLTFEDAQSKPDISKVRDRFVEKEVLDPALNSPRSTESYPSSSPQESKYKLEYQSPGKYSAPILLKEGLPLPLNEPLPVPIPPPHPHHLHHEDISGHTAGYGHGFHHHEQKLKAKPLKPSIVYRDPSDSFDHHDKIRTLDKDHLEKGPHHPYGPHHPSLVKGHDYDTYLHGKGIFKPEHYDQDKVPECAYKNKYLYNVTFCLDDPHYPIETIIWALKEKGPHAEKLISDVTYQSADNLVTGLTRAEEEGYTYKHYFGATHAQNIHLDKYKPPYHGYTYSTDYFKKGGYICPSDIFYARPKRAMNTFGKWKVIINVDHVPHHELVKYGHGHLYEHEDHHDHHHHHHGKPVDIGVGVGHGIYGKDPHSPHDKDHHYHHEKDHHTHHGKDHHLHHEKHHHHHEHHHEHHNHHEPQGYGGGDSYPGHHSIKKREYKEIKKSYTQTLRLEQCIYSNAPCSYVDSRFHSKCIQKHNFVRLVAWTHDEGIHVDTFKLPIACSCHVQQPIHFYHESGHHEHKHGHVVPPVNYHHHDHHSPHNHDHEPHGGLNKQLY